MIGLNPFSTACAPGDGEVYYYPMQLFTKGLKLWNTYLQGGKSQLAEAGSQSLYLPAKIIMNTFPNYFGYNLLLFLHYSFAGYFTYKYLKKINTKDIASIMGGIAFMFTGFMTAHKGHFTMVCVASYLPFLLYFIEKYIISKKKKDLFLLAIIWALSITADYTQISLYIGMVTFAYAIYRFFSDYGKQEVRKAFIEIIKFLLIVYILGTLLASFYLFPIIECLKYVTRENITYDFFSQYSFPLEQLGMILFPYLFGTWETSISETGYYGKWNLTEMAGYMGILVLVLAITMMIGMARKNSKVRFWSIVSIISFLLVLGNSTPLYKIMYKIPVYNMFRVPARNWFGCNFSICILFAIGINFFITSENDHFKILYSILKKVYVGIIISVAGILGISRGLVLLSKFFVLNPEYTDIVTKISQNTSITSKSISISLIIIILTGIEIWAIKAYRNQFLFWILTACLVLGDLFSFAHYHDKFGYPTINTSQNEIVNWIKSKQSNEEFRIWNLSKIKQLDSVNNQSHGIPSITSYGPIWLKNYAELTNFPADGHLSNPSELLKSPQLLSMLNVKYIIVDSETENLIETASQSTGITDTINNISQWEHINAFVDNKNQVTLNANQADYSLIQYMLPEATNVLLDYSFDVENEVSDEGIYVDVYETTSGKSIIQKYYSPQDIFNSKGKIEDSISYFGSDSNLYLRIFSYSKRDIIITSITFKEICTKEGTYIKKYEDTDGNAIYENTAVFNRSYFVNNVLDSKDVSTQIKNIKSGKINLNNTAVTNEDLTENNYDIGNILDEKYEENKVILSIETKEKSFLVLTDNFYPGWNVYLDGEKSHIYKVNGTQRGVAILGDGKHTVTFKFEPFSFYFGISISLTILFILLIYSFVSSKKLFSISK